jgi:hypothetical protein
MEGPGQPVDDSLSLEEVDCIDCLVIRAFVPVFSSSASFFFSGFGSAPIVTTAFHIPQEPGAVNRAKQEEINGPVHCQ